MLRLLGLFRARTRTRARTRARINNSTQSVLLALRGWGVVEANGFHFDPAQHATCKIDHAGKSNDWLFTGEARWHPECSSVCPRNRGIFGGWFIRLLASRTLRDRSRSELERLP